MINNYLSELNKLSNILYNAMHLDTSLIINKYDKY